MKRSRSSDEETVDTFFRDGLRIIQRKSGYRFSLDAVLLAHFVRLRRGGKVIDLGTGNGIIPLILASLYPSAAVVGLELQEEMVRRARRSLDLNRLGERVQIIQGDVRSVDGFFHPESFDAALCNPPYREAASGRMNPDPEKRLARHEIKARLEDFIRAGSYLLRRGGPMAMVYPASRMVDLLCAMRAHGVEPKRLRLVRSFKDSPAALVLAEGVKGGGSELKILPPLIVYAREKKYSREVKGFLGE